MREEQRFETIMCPHCGKEYMPAEIFIPDAFFGRPQNIERLNTGKIDYFDGKQPDLSEEYICDGCNTKFKVTARVSFKTTEINKYDMSKAYVTKLFDEKFVLPEV